MGQASRSPANDLRSFSSVFRPMGRTRRIILLPDFKHLMQRGVRIFQMSWAGPEFQDHGLDPGLNVRPDN